MHKSSYKPVTFEAVFIMKLCVAISPVLICLLDYYKSTIEIVSYQHRTPQVDMLYGTEGYLRDCNVNVTKPFGRVGGVSQA